MGTILPAETGSMLLTAIARGRYSFKIFSGYKHVTPPELKIPQRGYISIARGKVRYERHPGERMTTNKHRPSANDQTKQQSSFGRNNH